MGRALTKKTSKTQDSIRQILSRAVKNNVTDVHIEPGERVATVRYRRGGSLYVANKLPARVAADLVRGLKGLAGLDLNQVSSPQQGEAELSLESGGYRATVATLPALDGEKVTIHFQIYDSPQALEDMGLWSKPLASVKNSLAEKHGLIIVASPQAQAANNSLADLLHRLDLPGQKLAFVNPGETALPEVVAKISGASNSTLLGRALRQNFSAAALSTVADRLTAKKIETAAKSEAKLLIRLPAGSAVQGLAFWHQLHGQLTTLRPTIIAQLNIRTLCPYCSESYAPSVIEQLELDDLFHSTDPGTMQQLHRLEETARDVGLEKDQPLGSSASAINQLWRAKPGGCVHCDHSGFDGDIGIFEVYKPSDSFTAKLMAGESLAKLQNQAVSEGMISMKVDTLIKALRGLIDLRSLLDVCAVTP